MQMVLQRISIAPGGIISDIIHLPATIDTLSRPSSMVLGTPFCLPFITFAQQFPRFHTKAVQLVRIPFMQLHIP